MSDVTAPELMREGGRWLGAVRNRIKWRGGNGERVIWGSHDIIDPPLSIREVEELGAEAAAAEYNEFRHRLGMLVTRFRAEQMPKAAEMLEAALGGER